MFNLHFIEEVYGLSKIFLSWNEVGWVFSYISFSRKRWYKGELPWQQMYILDNTATRTHYCDFKPSSLYSFCFILHAQRRSNKYLFIPPLPEGGGGYTVLPLSVCPSFRPSKIIFVTFFSVTVDGRNLIFGHKRHIAGVDVTAGPLARGQYIYGRASQTTGT